MTRKTQKVTKTDFPQWFFDLDLKERCFFKNKIGTCQCTQAVWNTFAETPGSLIHYLGLLLEYFRLEFVMSRTSQHTWDLQNLSYDCDLWKHLVFWLLLALFLVYVLQSKLGLLNCLLLLLYNFLLLSCLNVCSQNVLLTSRSTWASGLLFEMCSWVRRLNFTRENSFKGTPLGWALANVFFWRLHFLLHDYCEQNETVYS